MTKKVIVIGAGIAGPLLAIQLKRAGYQVEVFEAKPDNDTREGVFLGITPNGLNVLKEFVPVELLKADYTMGSMFFFNSKGREIGELSTDYQKIKYGEETMQVKRWYLNSLIHKAAKEQGIEIKYGRNCVQVKETSTGVLVTFEDGSTTPGDILIGCDGAFSAVRKAVFPERAKPAYTKNISTGGFAFLPEHKNASKGINMAFGERGFFAYAVSNKGEVWWFNNYHREKEPAKDEIKRTLKDEIKEYLLDLHKNDDPLFSKIVGATTDIIAYPVYDIPKLKKWHSEHICLIGDAAHATSPHVGQGASLAMEDTVCLVRCLAENADTVTAFEKFQKLRQKRVEKIIRQSRKIGNAKSKPGAVAVWFRDRMLQFFIKAQIKQLDDVYSYNAKQPVVT